MVAALCYNISMVKSVDMSVGITVHDEGYLLHKTLRCLFEGLSLIEEKGYTYEILVNADNSDPVTKKYLKTYEKDNRFTIFYTKFADAGLSRNNIIEHAKGKYLCLIDGDDMVSSNWFLESIKYLEAHKGQSIALHPAAVLVYGTNINPIYCPINSSENKASDAAIMLGSNRWPSLVLAPRSVFVETPYMATKDGYGHEDYFFNTEVIAKGGKHVALPNTVKFYRRKEGSALERNNANHVIQPYSDLFSIDYFKSMPAPVGAEMFGDGNSKAAKYVPTNFSQKLPKPLQQPYLAMRNNDSINSKIIPVAKAIKKVVHPRVGKKKESFLGFDIPEYLLAAWRDINKIENQLYPNEYNLNDRLEYYENDGANRRVGPAFWHLAKQIPTLPDYIIFVPWLIAGGAERLVLNYIEALAKIYPKWNIAVVTTEKKQNVWADKLPKNAYLIDFGNTAARLLEEEKEILFSRLITQLKCKRLHIANSALAYRWVAKHKELIKANYCLNVSIFCNDIVTHKDGGEEICGYTDPALFEIFPVVNKIFTDNQKVIDYIIETNGYLEKDKFKVHYQPTCVEIVAPKQKELKKPMRLFWASRINPQKQPEVLVEIAKALEKQAPGEFMIDAYGTVDKTIYKDNPIRRSKSLRYRGTFSGFSSLPLNQYDAMLYTAKYDGLPNIVLEAIAAGMPVITSDAGGVGEIIKDQKTGLLVKNVDSVEDFVDAITYAKQHYEELPAYAKAAQKVLEEEHSWESFINNLKKDIKND